MHRRSRCLNKRTITFSSVTYAHKAKRLLVQVGISSRLVKLDAATAKNGCTHGLEFAAEDFYNVVLALKKAGIDYSYITTV